MSAANCWVETVVQGAPAPLKVGATYCRISSNVEPLGSATRLRLPVLMGITAETWVMDPDATRIVIQIRIAPPVPVVERCVALRLILNNARRRVKIKTRMGIAIIPIANR